jgi:hypothetical protein
VLCKLLFDLFLNSFACLSLKLHPWSQVNIKLYFFGQILVPRLLSNSLFLVILVYLSSVLIHVETLLVVSLSFISHLGIEVSVVMWHILGDSVNSILLVPVDLVSSIEEVFIHYFLDFLFNIVEHFELIKELKVLPEEFFLFLFQVRELDLVREFKVEV